MLDIHERPHYGTDRDQLGSLPVPVDSCCRSLYTTVPVECQMKSLSSTIRKAIEPATTSNFMFDGRLYGVEATTLVTLEDPIANVRGISEGSANFAACNRPSRWCSRVACACSILDAFADLGAYE